MSETCGEKYQFVDGRGEGSRFTEGSFVLGHFYISHAGTIGRGRGEQVMGRNGTHQKICEQRGVE